MDVENVINIVKDFFANVLKKPGDIIGACLNNGSWTVQIEVTEEDEYQRRHGRNELLGVYQVKLNENQEIVCYTRIMLRERGKIKGYLQDSEDP
ncbi:gas vesicle protein GvpO [Candidatus Desulforudis audaxviator]|uniref:Gas vesicle synthesis family protein n=1 Tax=Desulforudis audaxviator (strain MP104C) TaxID=477974 RepID=B1I4T3_DESAP|nr:gas vesicle protein GvpO [Candidatus Desulforudis audaxviator]ACA60002.1 hypothetical protein Daud_1496 [Candidatus Desulforudis audaxviator MP104C]AZK60018.1 gas vesicle protein GvpR [Candidatus Desulforudis audaxviator]